jgi:hypothetical protein
MTHGTQFSKPESLIGYINHLVALYQFQTLAVVTFQAAKTLGS